MSGNVSPYIVLVEPQIPENIGMCARAMLNCGLNQLRLVRPRKGWPHEAARRTAADADEVLDRTQVFDSLDEAIADCRHVIAATARPRALALPVLEAEEAAEKVSSWGRVGATSAVLFGAEACGLETDSVARADYLLKFATNPDFPTLNLAQSVLLFSWEWRAASQRDREPDLTAAASKSVARRGDLEAFFQRLERALEERGFFLTPELRPTVVTRLRSLFVRASPEERELSMLHGVLTALLKEGRGASASPDEAS